MRSFIGRDFFIRLQQVRIRIQNFELLGSNLGISQCLHLKGTRSKMLDHKQDLPFPVCLEEFKSYKTILRDSIYIFFECRVKRRW